MDSQIATQEPSSQKGCSLITTSHNSAVSTRVVMVYHKAARNPRSEILDKSSQAQTFPADLLPTELIHMVFKYLEPKEAAPFRWAGRLVAEIGLEYLISKVHLQLNERSYDRLFAIAAHPVVSKYIVELEYENEGLGFIDRESFAKICREESCELRRHILASPHAWRDFEKVRHHSHEMTEGRFDRVWSAYETYLADHKKVEQANFYPEKMTQAFKRLPNLKMISTPTNNVYERCFGEMKELSLLPYCFEMSEATLYLEPVPLGIGATYSVLLAVESAALQIDSLRCHPFSWQTLTQEMRDISVLNKSILHLKTMDITFSEEVYCPRDYRQETANASIEYCLRRKGRVLSLLASARNLQCLRLGSKKKSFKLPPTPRLDEIVGNIYWPSLKAVSLDQLVASEKHLVEFCERHAHTLKDLSLRGISLRSGFWSVAFHRIRRAFRLGQQLDACKLGGVFWGNEGPTNMDSRGTRISDYIRNTEIGDITLDEYHAIVGFSGLKNPLDWLGDSK